MAVPTASPSDVEIQAKSPQPGDASSKPTSPESAGAEKEADDLQEKLTRKASEVFHQQAISIVEKRNYNWHPLS